MRKENSVLGFIRRTVGPKNPELFSKLYKSSYVRYHDTRVLAPVVQRLDNAIHRIDHYPADSVVCFVNTYPLDSDLSAG